MNIGIIGIIVLPFGLIHLYQKNPIYFLSILIYLILVIITILGWRNVAVRYTLSLHPLIAVILAEGLHFLKIKLIDKLPSYRNLCYFMLVAIMTIPMINNFVSYFNNL